jgi:sugar phosphate isomerase/epimerase
MRRIGSSRIRLNYDFGNVISHFKEEVSPEQDYEPAMPYMAHLHLKDTARSERGWVYSEIGAGMIDYRKILENLRSTSLPVSLEIPLRLLRLRDGTSERSSTVPVLSEIERTVSASLSFVNEALRV